MPLTTTSRRPSQHGELSFSTSELEPQYKSHKSNSYNQSVPSAVTIIVVTIFIAIFQNYRIIFLSRYFLCVRNDIFAQHLRYASTIDSPPVYSARFNHMPRTTWRVWLPPGDRGWAASPSVKDAATAFEVTCRRWSPCPETSLWRHTSQLAACIYVVAFKLV